MDKRPLAPLTLIVPYYRNKMMLMRQLVEMNFYPKDLHVIIVDDCSPEPAAPIVQQHASCGLLERLRLYRIQVDIPWNREQARNLGAEEAETGWIIQVDIDHILPAGCAHLLLNYSADGAFWYRFPRWRVGRADDTRRKDSIEDECTFGKIHPHMDSYMIKRSMYWEAGGYNEAFSGVLGGGSEFLRRLMDIAPNRLLPESISLHVHTRDVIPDASDLHCDRDTNPGKTIMRQLQMGKKRPKAWLSQNWERVL